MKTISSKTRRRLDIQGFDKIDDQTLAETATWLRLAFALCALAAATGTILASPIILWSLIPIAVLGAALSTSSFRSSLQLSYSTLHGDKRVAPNRFACGIGEIMIRPNKSLNKTVQR